MRLVFFRNVFVAGLFLVIIFVEPFFEFAGTLADTAHQLGDLFTAKKKQYDGDDEYDLPGTNHSEDNKQVHMERFKWISITKIQNEDSLARIVKIKYLNLSVTNIDENQIL